MRVKRGSLKKSRLSVKNNKNSSRKVLSENGTCSKPKMIKIPHSKLKRKHMPSQKVNKNEKLTKFKEESTDYSSCDILSESELLTFDTSFSQKTLKTALKNSLKPLKPTLIPQSMDFFQKITEFERSEESKPLSDSTICNS
ncbi:unnamed protein product [Moneuplotes crassus]|uniref:Uncharacterized protein n=1 Tax=Euplotes crassus TaxID=5936 RepID=A0AAD1XVI1_EUPCR|nr:unnamed protein product [Moneuplotes crassus]